MDAVAQTIGITAAMARLGLSVEIASLPAEIVDLAHLCLLDYVGVAIAGAQDSAVCILLDQALDEGQGSCSVIGHAAKLTPSQAALVNGTAGHALDYDDVHMALPGHVSVTMLPALLALGEARRLPPAEVLAAFVAGFETACRIGILVAPGHYARGFHATATIGNFAAAMACARLLRLSEVQTAQALGIAGTQAAGLKAQFGTMCKPFHAGKAAQNGLTAARVAPPRVESGPPKQGVSQGFCDAQSPNFSLEAALSVPAGGFHIRNNLFKFHASCYGTHGVIEAIRKLRVRECDLRRIESVTARVGAANDKMCNIQEPRSNTEAKFSLRLMTAFALHRVDTARLDAFDEAQVNAPDIIALSDKVRIVPETGLTMTQAHVTLRYSDGSEIDADHDAGIPEHDLVSLRTRLRAKFIALVSPSYGEAEAGRMVDMIAQFADQKQVRDFSKRSD